VGCGFVPEKPFIFRFGRYRWGVDWKHLKRLALAEVDSDPGGIAAPLREKAKALPVTFEPPPHAGLQADGIAPDTLGLLRPRFRRGGDPPVPLPPQIILFLENLWEFSEGDEESTPTKSTHLSARAGSLSRLDEDDLFDRGLD